MPRLPEAPFTSTHESRNVWTADVESLGEVPLQSARSVGTSDCPDIIDRQFGRPVSGSSLSAHVGHVVGLRSKKQVVWTYAQGYVARMQDLQVSRDYAISELPRDAMSTDHVLSRGNPELTISGSGLGTTPEPTTVGLFDLRPEALFEGTLVRHRRIIPCGVRPPEVAASRGPLMPSIVSGWRNN